MYSLRFAELEEKIRTNERVHGEESPTLVEHLCHLAHLYFIFGRCADAESAYWRAIRINGKTYGQEHISLSWLLADLGYVYESQQRWSEAEQVYRLSYAIKVKSLGAHHQDSLQAARSVVSVCRAQGKYIPEPELDRMCRAGG